MVNTEGARHRRTGFGTVAAWNPLGKQGWRESNVPPAPDAGLEYATLRGVSGLDGRIGGETSNVFPSLTPPLLVYWIFWYYDRCLSGSKGA